MVKGENNFRKQAITKYFIKNLKKKPLKLYFSPHRPPQYGQLPKSKLKNSKLVK